MYVSKRMFAEFDAYWRRLQDDLCNCAPDSLCIPSRRHFNPMAVPKQLPYLYMVEHVEDDAFTIRLTGTAIDQALGYPVTGTNMLDLYEGDERRFIQCIHRTMACQPCGAVLRRLVTLENGKAYDLVSKGLPLCNEDGVVRYVVGMMGADLSDVSLLGETATVSSVAITDFFFTDLGHGVPAENCEWGSQVEEE